MGINRSFWKNKRVFITGHTGFKGSWLSFWLSQIGAEVKGFALPPEVFPSLYQVLKLDEQINSAIGNICDYEHLEKELVQFEPDIIIHLAAQAIVRVSYEDPIETFQTNVIGTANLLNISRSLKKLKAFVSVTSDKCYENNEWVWKYRETDAMGGWDPYSASKGCAEIVTASFRRSFLQNDTNRKNMAGIATARAGNVIGGGDWSKDRLIPDIMRAFSEKKEVIIRNPSAVRPWQYILDLLYGYIRLAENLCHDPVKYSEAWNFGPSEQDEQSVKYIIDKMMQIWGEETTWKMDNSKNPHEASYLKLDSSKARMHLNWENQITLDDTLKFLTIWYKKYYNGDNMFEFSRQQIRSYEERTSTT